jgi:hypothetical protein
VFAACVAVVLALLDALGVPVLDWIRDLFDRVAEAKARSREVREGRRARRQDG